MWFRRGSTWGAPRRRVLFVFPRKTLRHLRSVTPECRDLRNGRGFPANCSIQQRSLPVSTAALGANSPGRLFTARRCCVIYTAPTFRARFRQVVYVYGVNSCPLSLPGKRRRWSVLTGACLLPAAFGGAQALLLRDFLCGFGRGSDFNAQSCRLSWLLIRKWFR